MSEHPWPFNPDSLKQLRALGIRRILFREGGEPIQIEFYPEAAPATPGEPLARKEDPVDMCVCGHDVISHDAQGFCLLGCLDKCHVTDASGKTP